MAYYVDGMRIKRYVRKLFRLINNPISDQDFAIFVTTIRISYLSYNAWHISAMARHRTWMHPQRCTAAAEFPSNYCGII